MPQHSRLDEVQALHICTRGKSMPYDERVEFPVKAERRWGKLERALTELMKYLHFN